MKYFRSVYQVEVLSNEPLGDISLEGIVYEITDGHCSGILSEVSVEEVDQDRMAELLVAQGSDPDFLSPV